MNKTKNENDVDVKRRIPKWFLIILSLLPILLWPLIFFGSIFIYDDPNVNPTHQNLLFIGINAYPVYLIVNMLLANKLYSKGKKIYFFFYLWPMLLVGLFFMSIFIY